MTMYFPARLRSRTVRGGATAGGTAPPLPSVDIDAVKAGLTLSVTENFDGTTLNAARWRVLAEPGRGQTSSLAPTLEWPDHWGQLSATDPTPSYIHNPAMVSLQDSVLRLTWSRIGGVWNVGGITSAASYAAPRGTLFNAPTRGLCEFRFRVPVMPAGSGGFGAIWRMPRDDTFGVWPASGEIDDLEWTQHPDGLTANGSGRNAYANIPNNWGVNLAGNSSTLTNPAVNILDGQWHTGATHQYADGTEEVLDFYLDGRRFHRTRIPAAYAARLRVPFVWLLTAQGPGFWGVGLPPDNTWLSWQSNPPVFEIDWLRHWVPTTPVPGRKPTTATVLQNKGLSLLWQDRLGETDAPTDDRQFFQEYTGARVTEDPPTGFPSESNRRLSFQVVDGKPCLQSVYRAGQHGWLNFRSQWRNQGYREFGLAVDVLVPSNFSLLNSSGGSIDGKSMFGLVCGHADHQRPGVPSGYIAGVPSGSWRGAVCFPEDQKGCELGLNTVYRNTTGLFELTWYPHIPGRMSGGTYYPRLSAFSQPWAISGVSAPPKIALPKGTWFELVLYGKVDTNAGDGVMEWYVNGVLQNAITGVDLGGWVGNRNLYQGRCATAAPSGMVENDTNRQQYSFGWGDLSNTDRGQSALKGGWRFRGIFIRDMLGGVTNSSARVPTIGGAYSAYNWRVYGKV